MLDSLKAIGQSLLHRLARRLEFSEPKPNGGAPIDLTDPVAGAVADADLLLAFAAQSHRSINGEKVGALTKAVGDIRAADVTGPADTPKAVAALWAAYDALAVEMSPLSAHSIRASMAVNAKRFPASLATPTAYNSAAAVAVFLLCLVLQVFWVVGKDLVDQADVLEVQKAAVQQRLTNNSTARSRNENKIKALEAQLCALATCDKDGKPRDSSRRVGDRGQLAVVTTELAQTRHTVEDAAIEGRELSEELDKLNERGRPLEVLIAQWLTRARRVCDKGPLEFFCPVISSQTADTTGDELRARVDTASAKLKEMRLSSSGEHGPASLSTLSASHELSAAQQDLSLHQADRIRTLVVEAKLFIANLGTYVIAMVMGVLGALAFILRTLSQQLKDHTYVPVAVSSSIVRVCLGAIAGVFGSLLTPGADATLKSLPPLFVPFVFGYGIEILFSLLDRVVRTFAQAEPTSSAP